MHVSQLKESKFLKKEDCGQNGILVTIKEVTQENVAKEGAPQELKYCLWVEEQDKPLVLNSTNGQLIAVITGQEDTDFWPGHKVVLYHDPTISFGGKIIGGVRVRAPRGQAAAKKAPPAAQPARKLPPSQQPQPEELAEQEGGDDSVPF